MTDNDIIKALECCSNAEPCENCPYQKQCDETDLAEIALELINRQKAEIERLERHTEMYHEVRAEAVKEFAERLKELKKNSTMDSRIYTSEMIDNLVKEMVGEG